MKKIILIIITVLSIKTFAFSQTTKNDFIGHWTSDETITECVIWIDKYGDFQYVSWDVTSGSSLVVLSIKFEDNKLFVRTRFVETNWVVSNEFTLIDEYNMTSKIAGDANTIIYYKKLK